MLGRGQTRYSASLPMMPSRDGRPQGSLFDICPKMTYLSSKTVSFKGSIRTRRTRERQRHLRGARHADRERPIATGGYFPKTHRDQREWYSRNFWR